MVDELVGEILNLGCDFLAEFIDFYVSNCIFVTGMQSLISVDGELK